MRISPSQQSHTAPPGNRNLRIETALQGHLIDPIFRFEHEVAADTKKIKIKGYQLGSGGELLRIPYRLVDSNRNNQGIQIHDVPDNWEIDLSTSTINTTTKIGGLVDGLGLAASTDYLVWAFFDPWNSTDKFQGFGVTARPTVTGSALTIGSGAVGTSTVYTTTANHGWRFAIGARVILRKGTTTGTAFNQGVITAQSASSLTITLDSTYGGITETNGTVSGSGIEILQLDRMEPRLYNDDSLYPGAGTEYQFAYIGHLRTDTSSNIKNHRKRGDWYDLNAFHLVHNVAVGGGTQVCLARWIPAGSARSKWQLDCQDTNATGTASTQLSTDNGADIQISSDDNNVSNRVRAVGWAINRNRDTSIYHVLTLAGGATGGTQAYLLGYTENQF